MTSHISRLVGRVGLLAATLGVAPAFAQEPPTMTAAVTHSGRVPEEVDQFKDTQSRYSERVSELEGDTRRFFEMRKNEELARLSEGYDSMLVELREGEQHRRTLAIQRLTDFLDRHVDVEDADNVRFRLAELWYEQASIDWIEAGREYEKRLEAYDAEVVRAEEAAEQGDTSLLEELAEPPAPPKKDVSKSIDLYEQIIANNEGKAPEEQWQHLDRAYYTLGFAYKDQQNEQFDLDKGEAAFQALVDTRPDSDLADAANLFMGNLLFNEKKEFEKSITKYQVVFDQGSDGKYYYEAMYQLAWTYYKLAGRDPERFEDASLDLFTNLLDDSEQILKDTGRESDFAPDARLNMARTFADIADRHEYEPVEVAERYFGRIGERPWERDVYFQLAEVLAGCVPVPEPCPETKQNRGLYLVDEAIRVYQKLQRDPRWVNEPDNPRYQRKIIWLLPLRTFPDPREIPQAQKELTDRYGEYVEDEITGERSLNPWWVANRSNPDALDEVRRYIESSLATVAVGMRLEAQDADDPEMYAAAAKKFREYLNKFPIADNYYEHQWYLADTLMRAKPNPGDPEWANVEAAIVEFESLMRSGDHHPYGDAALYRLMDAQRQLTELRHGPFDALPQDAAKERAYTTDWGKEIIVYKPSEDHVATIELMDRVRSLEFRQHDDAAIPDYESARNKNLPYFYYTPGLILFNHNRFEEARPRLLRVINDLPTSQEACFAARLVVKSYEAEGDLEGVRTWTGTFIGNPQLCSDARNEFVDAQQDAAFLQAQLFVNQANAAKARGDETAFRKARLEAAMAFEDYMREFPDYTTENYKFALYNAANSYDLAGKPEKANKLFEEYVDLYPDDDQTVQLLYRIAQGYQKTFELPSAIAYYEKLLRAEKAKKESKFSPIAAFNIAFLKIGLGDNEGAARGFEQYAKDYPNESDAAEVFFRAGEQWEEVGNDKARFFYERYLKTQYAKDDPNTALKAQYKMAKLQLEKGWGSAHDKSMAELRAMFDKFVKQDAKLGPLARHYAAEAGFMVLEEEFEKFTKEKLFDYQACSAPAPCKPLENNQRLLEEKDAALPAFKEKATKVVSLYQDFEYSTAAILLMAKATLYVAETGYGMEVCSERWDDDACDVWVEVFEESLLPLLQEFEEDARVLLEGLAKKAAEERRHTPYVDMAQEILNRLDPLNYPEVKTEVRGEPRPETYPNIPPMRVDDKQQKGE